MFHVESTWGSVLYTGDYNTNPDRHLGAAYVPTLYPDLMISEATYATLVRGSRMERESSLFQEIHECLESGGSVLIPVFAVGRAQEMLTLLEDHWIKYGLEVPVFFTKGLIAQANLYYSLYVRWTSQILREKSKKCRIFSLDKVQMINSVEEFLRRQSKPAVIFATPSTLSAGASLELFKAMAVNPSNLVIIPGYTLMSF